MNAELLDRLPPSDASAEKGVLGSAMLLADVLDDVMLVLRSDAFYADANAKIFAHLVGLHEEGKRADADLLVARLKKAGDLEAVGGPAYVAEVMQSVAVPSHAVYYAEIVRDKAILRQLIQASVDTIQAAYNPTSEAKAVLDAAERAVYAVRDERSTGSAVTLMDVLLQAMATIDKRAEGGAVGLPTGFVDLDKMTGGLHDGELVIVAARPSVGKTAFALNVAEHVSIDGDKPVMFASLEMSEMELASRLLSARSGVNGHWIRNGTVSEDDRQRLVVASNEMSQHPMLIDDTPVRTVSELAAISRRAKRKGGLRLLIVDYLQLVAPDDRRAPRHEQVADIGRRLKALARDLSIPVLCVAQLNRRADETDRPKLSFLRESGSLEQDADVVIFVHRDVLAAKTPDEKSEAEGKAELIVAKQRNGPTGEVKLAWRKECTKFENLAPSRYDEFDQFDGRDTTDDNPF